MLLHCVSTVYMYRYDPSQETMHVVLCVCVGLQATHQRVGRCLERKTRLVLNGGQCLPPTRGYTRMGGTTQQGLAELANS